MHTLIRPFWTSDYYTMCILGCFQWNNAVNTQKQWTDWQICIFLWVFFFFLISIEIEMWLDVDVEN